jgi:hypothetical protein
LDRERCLPFYASSREALRQDRMDKVLKRFWSKVDKTDSSGCWVWIASRLKGGGQFSLNGKPYPAHRFAYELHFGHLPVDSDVRRSCKNSACVKPSHLLLDTRKSRLKHSHSICRNGHSYSQGNTYMTGTGIRICRICRKLRNKRWRAKKLTTVFAGRQAAGAAAQEAPGGALSPLHP